MDNADSVFWADKSGMPNPFFAYRGGVTTVTMTDNKPLKARIRNQAFDQIKPAECFTAVLWELIEEGTQPLTTAYGGSPFTFINTTHQPTQIQIADLGSTIPCGSYKFNLKVTVTTTGITKKDSATIILNYSPGTYSSCGDVDLTSISTINPDPDNKWLPADIGVVGISKTNAIPFVFDNGSPIVPKVYDSGGNEISDLSCFCSNLSM